jgi:hypothetical protein
MTNAPFMQAFANISAQVASLPESKQRAALAKRLATLSKQIAGADVALKSKQKASKK